MSEQHDQLTPLDSASNVSSRRKRPGKAQRQAARAASTVSQASAATGASSVTGQARFASRIETAPVPQPGKFPIVFPTGPGEPTKDEFIAISGETLASAFLQVPDNFISSSRYAEFSSHAAYDDDSFSSEMLVAATLGLAQQLVHAHVNLGLPMGDFSAVATTEVYNPMSVRAIIHQFGEFAVESLGTRFLFKGYQDEVTALVRTAKLLSASENDEDKRNILMRHWLPVRLQDDRTRFILASRLTAYFAGFGITLDTNAVCAAVFTNATPAYNAAKAVLPAGERNIFDRLFNPITTKQEFIDAVSSVTNRLGLSWIDPDEDHLVFDVTPKTEFPKLIEPWLRKKPTITKFFSCGSGVAERTSAVGSPAQLCTVSTVSGVTVVTSHVAVSAEQYSLAACFPPTAVVGNLGPKNVVMTTSLVPRVRAVEFMQRDWM